MSSLGLVRRAGYMLVAVVFCVLFMPRLAAADSADVYVTLTGTGCVVSGSSCTGSDPVTGTYTVDPTTGMIVGDWSFTTPIGTISGDGAQPSESVAAMGYPAGIDAIDFFTPTSSAGVQLAFSSADPYDGTLVVSPDSTLYPTQPPSLGEIFGTGATFDFLSGTATASTVATPEPSSIALLGFGLLGLFILRRKRSSSRMQPVQS